MVRWFLLATLLLVEPRAADRRVVDVTAGRTAVVVVAPPERIVVPAGSFVMGSSPDEIRAAYALCASEYRAAGALTLELSARCAGRFNPEAPQMDVVLPAYALDRSEVTVGAYQACVRAGACDPAPVIGARPETANQPVERVTWQEAVIHCRWRGGRLPTEAEWEKAARGIGGRIWPWGSRWEGGRANHGRLEQPSAEGTGDDSLDGRDGFEGPAPVGSFRAGAGPYGHVDMAGNVWEWTAGYFAREPPQMATRISPHGPLLGDERTLRGGSYRSPPSDLRAARRIGIPPTERAPTVGFRCAYDLPR